MKDALGAKIKDLRKECGMTQEELGVKIGVSKATVNKYETGIVVNLKRPTIEKIAAALGVDPGYLMGWSDNSVKVGPVQTNNGVIGQTNAPVIINNGDSGPRTLSKEEIEILRIYNSLDVKSRMKLLSTAIDLEEQSGEE